MDIIKSTYTEVAEGQTGSEVAEIINTAQGHVYSTEQYDITQSDIVDYAVEYNHGKGTRKIHVSLYDNDWILMNTADIFTITDANNWILAVNNAITGTWHLIITYLP
jgi:hypothetical protein